MQESNWTGYSGVQIGKAMLARVTLKFKHVRNVIMYHKWEQLKIVNNSCRLHLSTEESLPFFKREKIIACFHKLEKYYNISYD
jgi:hypothetical protein